MLSVERIEGLLGDPGDGGRKKGQLSELPYRVRLGVCYRRGQGPDASSPPDAYGCGGRIVESGVGALPPAVGGGLVAACIDCQSHENAKLKFCTICPAVGSPMTSSGALS